MPFTSSEVEGGLTGRLRYLCLLAFASIGTFSALPFPGGGASLGSLLGPEAKFFGPLGFLLKYLSRLAELGTNSLAVAVRVELLTKSLKDVELPF